MNRDIAQAATAALLATLAMACSGASATPPIGTAGCERDTDCKGARICVSGACTDVDGGSLDGTLSDAGGDAAADVAPADAATLDGAITDAHQEAPTSAGLDASTDASQDAAIVEASQDSGLSQYPWGRATTASTPGTCVINNDITTAIFFSCSATGFKCAPGSYQPWVTDPMLVCSPGMADSVSTFTGANPIGETWDFCCNIGGDAAPPENTCSELFGCCNALAFAGEPSSWITACRNTWTAANQTSAANGDQAMCQTELSWLQDPANTGGSGSCTDYGGTGPYANPVTLPTP